jgi:predicted O-linked N-acetylglucosamine transferase (SPINDLY family)
MSAALSRRLRQAQERLRNGDPAGAEALCKQLLRDAPRNPDALLLYAAAQLTLGRPREALESLQRALVVDPRNGAVLESLGLAHLMLGEFASAEDALASAARLPGAPASVFMRLGTAILEQGRPVEALAALRKAVAMDPQGSDGLLNLGRALAGVGDTAAAREQFQSALRMSPDNADAAFNLAVLAEQNGELAQARDYYQRALSSQPRLSVAHARLGAVLFALGNTAAAIMRLRAAIEIDPGNADALSTLARAQYETGQLDEAEAAAKRALELNPNDTAAYATLANRHLVRGEIASAIELLEQAHATTREGGLIGILTFQLRQVCDWVKWRMAWNVAARQLEEGADLGSPFWLLCEPTSAMQQLEYTRRWAANRFDALPRSAPPAPVRTRDRLKIGYLSSDLHEHATAYLIAEVLELHDRSRYEIFAYSYGPEDNSPTRRRLRAACEHFIDIARETDDAAAKSIRGDALDVLIDLKGYTLGDRLTIMARRPSAIQVSWLGYPGTTGAPFIDYLIADPFVIPEEAQSAYSERIARLPHCYQPNDRKRAVSEPRSRREYGLPERGFVFCCFNQSYKITPDVFSVWMGLLRALDNSVLWLLESNRWARDNLLSAAREHGVDVQRIVFAPRLPQPEHLSRYRVADLALDTFPYTSHTTMSDALWCGCPAVALCGDTFASRVSGSVLSAANVPDLITHCLADYEALALRLATDRDYCASVRVRVGCARDASPLFDSEVFTRALENLYVGLIEQPLPNRPMAS